MLKYRGGPLDVSTTPLIALPCSSPFGDPLAPVKIRAESQSSVRIPTNKGGKDHHNLDICKQYALALAD